MVTTLLTFRDNIKAFFSRYDYILTPILKFVLALLVFFSVKQQMGYMPIFGNVVVMLLLSGICAFLPVEFTTGIGGVIIILESTQVAIDAALVGLALVFPQRQELLYYWCLCAIRCIGSISCQLYLDFWWDLRRLSRLFLV